jgi:aminopeptidase
MADILVDHSARIQPGDRVAVEGTTAAEPLIRALYRKILSRGGHPHLLLKIPEQTKELFNYGSQAQISSPDLFRKFAYDQFESRIKIHSLTNTQALNEFSSEKQTWHQGANSDILATQMKRGAGGEFKWVTTLYPTRAYAEEAGLSLEEYQDFVYQACLADQEDAVAIWKDRQSRQQEALQLFQGQDQVQLSGPNIDLRLSVSGRQFINCFGRRNLPDGEIFTGPVEGSAAGWVRFSYPAIYNGVVVKGVELIFEDGRVIQASAEDREDYLLEMLDADQGARFLGEFAVGMNSQINRFTGNILFDEKIGGTIHLALGAGYPESGSRNRSMIHWDMICDMREDSEIHVDGSLVYQDGKFLL